MYAGDVEKAAFSACIQDVPAVLGYTDETDDVGRRRLSGDEGAERAGRVCGDLYEYDSRDPVPEKLGITRWIDGVVTSEEASVEKPDYRIFSLCREKAEVLPEDCVFIGDSLRHDIEGAKQAGMQVIWYHKAELSEEEQQKAAQENIPVMRQFSQCIELLQSYVQRERGQKRCLED